MNAPQLCDPREEYPPSLSDPNAADDTSNNTATIMCLMLPPPLDDLETMRALPLAVNQPEAARRQDCSGCLTCVKRDTRRLAVYRFAANRSAAGSYGTGAFLDITQRYRYS